jgi:hypothetical protein
MLFPLLSALTSGIDDWLLSLNDPIHPGQVRFCRQGNLIEPSKLGGLGASCLALKISYQIRQWDRLDNTVRELWVAHVRSFQCKRSGYFEDQTLLPIADRSTGWLCFKKDMGTRRAETRQAGAALLGVGSTPFYPVSRIPMSPTAVLKYLDGLPWDSDPWGAGSQCSHLAFFLKLNADVLNQHEPLQELLPVILKYLDDLQDFGTGSWFRGKPPLYQQVNAAMKVLTIYRLFGQPFRWPEQLIDLCLTVSENVDACHSVDVLFVLHECAVYTTHRRDEIRLFAEKMLTRIQHHHKSDGAFSFFPDYANTSYYGVPISQGLAESDVHGTHLLVWAITLCASLLDFQTELGWRFPVA